MPAGKPIDDKGQAVVDEQDPQHQRRTTHDIDIGIHDLSQDGDLRNTANGHEDTQGQTPRRW